MPQQVQPQRFDVLVIGGGAAGLYSALCLPRHYRVGLITKETLSQSASDWAQGGIAAAIASDDSVQLHLEDTLSAGAGLCDLDAVRYLVNQAPDCIESLLELGVAFDQSGDRPALTLEAAHRRPRVLHAADATGRAVVVTLTRHVYQRPNIEVLSGTFVFDLWLNPETGECQGAIALHNGVLQAIEAAVVVLATGGGGQVFFQTTNPPASTGDGVAMAWRAGATLRDLEFMQFHPTALMKPGAPHFLISEAVRGEGAHLLDQHGHRFMFDYHPAGELASRDIVSRSIYQHLQQQTIQASQNGDRSIPHVWLDLRPIAPEVIQRRFPTIIQRCQSYGIDVFTQPIPVAPAAHYWMGGVLTDLESATSISRLYAVGETASTGVHGANRLASNSLLECVVFGHNMAHLPLPPPWRDRPGDVPTRSAPAGIDAALSDFHEWRSHLQQWVWSHAGICREQASLDQAIAQVAALRQQFNHHGFSQWLLNTALPQMSHSSMAVDASQIATLQTWGELRNLLDIASLILKSAAFRTESRGGHYRRDYPDAIAPWQVHTLVQDDRLYTSTPASPQVVELP